MSSWLDQFGTSLTEFQIGLGGSGVRRLRFKNSGSGNLEWNPTATQTLTLPDKTAVIAVEEDLGARVYHSVDQSLGNAATTVLAFNSELKDTDTIHSNSTNNSRLTCKTDGCYAIGGTVVFAANATGLRQILIRLNGATTIAVQRVPANSSDSILSVATHYTLSANDYVELLGYQNSGGSLNVVATAPYFPDFYLQKV